MPLAIPILNTFTVIFGPLVMAFMARLGLNARTATMAFLAPGVRYLFPLLPFALLILSAIYAVPSDLLACGLESQWSRLFRAKDENAIRTIEQGLRCCGFNSLHDRAWPFPSHDVDARACERTLGYTVRCVDPWRRQQQVNAGLVVLASLLNWLLLVRSCMFIDFLEIH
jgi:hypothetical protein